MRILVTASEATPHKGGLDPDIRDPAYWKREQAIWMRQRDGETDADWIGRLRRHFAPKAATRAETNQREDARG